MDIKHAGLTSSNIEADSWRSTSSRRSSETICDKTDARTERSLLVHPLISGIASADNVTVTTYVAPLPIDMIIAIGEHLGVKDWPRFFSLSRAIYKIYDSKAIGYVKSLSTTLYAFRLPAIIDALSAIARYRSEDQPELLHALAVNIRRQTHGPAYGATTEWNTRIDAQFDWHNAQASGAERNVALQQLIIAAGLALTEHRVSRSGKHLRHIIGKRLEMLSPEYWPPIFKALLPCRGVQKLLRAYKFAERFRGSMPALSPEFSVMIALEFVWHPHEYADTSTLLRERFGVSDACLRGVLDPLVADTIVKMAMRQSCRARNAWLAASAQQWRQHDPCFAARVTDAFVEFFDADVYRPTAFSYNMIDDFTYLPELKRKVRERAILLESPTIIALRDTLDDAEAHIEAFLKIARRIAKRPICWHYTAILDDIVAMPLLARPALLHRLISTVQIGGNDQHTIQTFIDTASECRNVLLTGDPQNGPLLSRVSAALILVAGQLRRYDVPAADAIVAEAGELALLHASPAHWGDVLQALIQDGLSENAIGPEAWERINQHIAFFVCLPNTSAHHLSTLLFHIAKTVGSLWHQLPDEADGARTRFDVFRQRIGITSATVARARQSIAESLVSHVVAGHHPLEDVATEARFDDLNAIEALENALFMIVIRPTLRADSDVDAITKQYTKRSLYLRSLIAQEVSDLVILSNTKNAIA